MHNSLRYNQKPTVLSPCRQCGSVVLLEVTIDRDRRAVTCQGCGNGTELETDEISWQEDQSMGIVPLVCQWNKENPSRWEDGEYVEHTDP